MKESRVLPKWMLVSVVVLSLSVIVAIVLSYWKLVGQVNKGAEGVAKLNLGIINRQQQDFYKEYKRFALSSEISTTDFSRMKISDKEVYEFQFYVLDSTKAIGTATAQKDGIRSYTAIVFVISAIESITNSEICVTDKPSRTPPKIPQVSGNVVECPPGSSSLSK
jgi:hypothetical protein